MAWIDVKGAFDSVDHTWLNQMLDLHRFSLWLSRTISRLCSSLNIKVATVTRQGAETSQNIRFQEETAPGTLCIRDHSLSA